MAEVVELLEVSKRDSNLASFAVVTDCHFSAERKADPFLQGLCIRVYRRSSLRRAASGFPRVLPEFFDVSHSQALGDYAIGDGVGISHCEQSPSMTCGNGARGEERARSFRQIHEPQRIGYVTSALSDDPRYIGLVVSVVRGELRITLRLLQSIEIRPLNVLDDGNLERFAVADFQDKNRDLMQTGALGRPPTSLARDDLIGVGDSWDGPN